MTGRDSRLAATMLAAALGVVHASGCGGPTTSAPDAEALDLQREHLGQARALRDRGDLDGALGQAARALVAAPTIRESYAMVSQLYVELGNDEDAVGFFELAAKNYSDLAEPWYYLGFHEYRLDRWDAALESFEMAAEIDPEDPRHLFRIGLIRQAAGDFEGAQAALARAHELDSGDATIAARYSRVLRVGGDYSEAERVISSALESSPESPDLHYALGQLRLREGRDADAETALRRAIELAPLRSDAHHDLARLLSRTERAEEGRREELRADRLRDYTDARGSLTRLANQRPDDPEVILALVELELTERNPGSAARWLARAEGLEGAGDRVAALGIELALMSGELERARAAAAPLLGSADPRVGLALAAVELSSGNRDEGLRRLDRALSAAPAERSFLRRAADLYERAGMMSESEALLDRASTVSWALASEAGPGMRSEAP